MSGVLMYLGVGALVLSVLLLFCWDFAQQKRRMDMQTPLLAEAESGFVVCPGCEFENFKRYSYCNLCGEKLTIDSADGPKSKKMAWKWRAAAEDPTPTLLTAPKEFTAQQLRVRKRKEWVRKVDVDGHMFWYRSCSDAITADPTAGIDDKTESQQPGYVATFQCSKSSGNDPAVIVAGAAADINPANTSESESPSMTAMDSSLTMDIVLASEVNAAAQLNLNLSANDKRAKLNEIMDLASRDFPTKYAHFSTITASLIVPAKKAFLKISVHRNYLLEESISHVSCIDEKNIHSYIRINFLEERGVDAGGVYREWFMLVNEQLLNPTLGLFQCTNKAEQSYFLNPNSAHCIGEDHLAYYFATGRLIGRALLEGSVWGFHLSLPLIKIILGIPVTFSDLEYLDPEAYRSLVWLRDNNGAEHLGLDCSVTEKQGDDIVTIDLVPNGHNIDVTDANKHEYLERKFKYTLFESVSRQLGILLKGLYEVIPQELLMLFDTEEFDYLLCGSNEIDVEDWKVHTITSADLTWGGVLGWFWEVVAEMPNEYRRRLLLFATGSSRVPLGGFAGLTSYDGRLCPFTLKGVPYSKKSPYISSHACFNRLDVPLYRSKKKLRTVLMAILDTDLHGFTTA